MDQFSALKVSNIKSELATQTGDITVHVQVQNQSSSDTSGSKSMVFVEINERLYLMLVWMCTGRYYPLLWELKMEHLLKLLSIIKTVLCACMAMERKNVIQLPMRNALIKEIDMEGVRNKTRSSLSHGLVLMLMDLICFLIRRDFQGLHSIPLGVSIKVPKVSSPRDVRLEFIHLHINLFTKRKLSQHSDSFLFIRH